jgi:ribosomal protein S18 acetylase RimI-like enzyme
MNILIRQYKKEDEIQLKKCILELKLFESKFDSYYLTDKNSVDKLFLEIIKEKDNGGEILVAQEEKKIVGFISLAITTKNDELILKKINVLYISDMVVLPEYRGQGIGTMLLQKAEDLAKQKKIKFLKLIVFAQNVKAKKLYEEFGFTDYEVTMIRETMHKPI